MDKTSKLLAEMDPTLVIENEVLFLDNVNEMERLSAIAPVKMDYNAIVICRHGRLMLELGGSQQVKVASGQLLLVPAQKLMQPMMVSTDIDVSALLVSDRVFKLVLGAQIDIWNRAMYLHETYVVDIQRWSEALHSHAHSIFRGAKLELFKEFVLASLRIFLLIICEELLRLGGGQQAVGEGAESCNREKLLFNRFLELLRHERQKKQQVAYYAERLCITPKYLSTVCHNVSGKSPMHWIADGVMEDSYALLCNTDLTVKEIAHRLGFPNSSFFGQYFRAQAGVTPLMYRTKYRNRL